MEKQFEKPMKWYKFVIYFHLFAVAVGNCVSAISYFNGAIHQLSHSELEWLYDIAGSLKILDTYMGIVCIFLVVMSIIARQKLAHFDEQGPKLYLGSILIAAGANLLYTVLSFAIILQASHREYGTTFSESVPAIIIALSTSVGICVSCSIMYILNKIYFDKRKEYFVNLGTSVIPGVKNVISQPPKNEVPVQPFSGSQNVPPVQPQPREAPHYVPTQPQPETKQKHGVLVGLCGLYAGAQIEMKDGEMITFGRADDNNLIFASEPRISRHHCMIRWNAQKQKYIFRDYSSSGSYINDQQDCLPQNLDLEIACGSKIALGNNDNVFLFQ